MESDYMTDDGRLFDADGNELDQDEVEEDEDNERHRVLQRPAYVRQMPGDPNY